MRRLLKWFIGLLGIALLGPLAVYVSGAVELSGDWRTADRASAGIAPDPASTPEAVVQVYAARAFRWRGVFGVHSWIATKSRNARHWVVHDVVGWRGYYGDSTVASYVSQPDSNWFGARPELLADLRGPQAQAAIARIAAASRDYPHAYDYAVWPGPNSNTFVAHVARAVPELRLDLPPTAIGKDYLANAALMDTTPSGTGVQLSLVGALGVLLGVEEGVELNLLGLTLGVDPLDLALKLPGVGRIGWR